MKGKSPVVRKQEKEFFGFSTAIAKILQGSRVTRLEWNDVRWYCFMKDGLLSIHKAGEASDTFRAWIINDGDISGKDWYVLEDDKNA